MARPRVERSSHQESQPAQHRVHFALGAAALGWPHHKDERCTHFKAVFFNELQEGKRDHGAPRKRYKDQLKRQLAQAGISRQSWQQEASDRDSWRSSVRKAGCEFEAEKNKRRKGKTQEAERASSIPTILIPNLRLSKVR